LSSEQDVYLFRSKFSFRLERKYYALEQLLKVEKLYPERESEIILLSQAFRRRKGYGAACRHHKHVPGYGRK
jgi:hypothetical protein